MGLRSVTVLEATGADGTRRLICSPTITETYVDAGVRAEPYLLQEPSAGAEMPSVRQGGEGVGVVGTIPAGYVGGLATRSGDSEAIVANPLPPTGNTRAMTKILDWRLEGVAATQYRQAIEHGATVPALSDSSWIKSSWTIETVTPRGNDEIAIPMRPKADILQDRLTLPRYLGVGGDAALILGSGDTLGWTGVVAAGANAWLAPSLTGSWMFEFIACRIDLTANTQGLLQWGDGTTDGIKVTVNGVGAKKVKLNCFGLTDDSVQTADDVLSADAPMHIAVWRDASRGGIGITIGGVEANYNASTGTITDPGSVNLDLGGGNSAITICELRVWNSLPTAEEIASRYEQRAEAWPGLLERWEYGATSPSVVYTASSGDTAHDSDSSSGTPTFGYGGEGDDSNRGHTHPLLLGTCNHMAFADVDPGVGVGDFGSTALTSVSLTMQGVTQTGGGTDYTANSPHNGLITIVSLTGTLDQIRVTATGIAVTDYADLLEKIVFDSGIGPAAIADQASSWGAWLDQTGVGYWIASLDEPPEAQEVLPDLLRGAGAVLVDNADGELDLIRVPALPWDMATEADGTIEAGVETFGQGGVTVDGHVLDHPVWRQNCAYSPTEDPLPPEDIDYGTIGTPLAEADRLRTNALRADFLIEHWAADPDDRDDDAIQSQTIPARVQTAPEAEEIARLRFHSDMKLRGARVFSTDLRTADSAFSTLGSRIVLKAPRDLGTPADGIPCIVTRVPTSGAVYSLSGSGRYDFGEVGLLEMRQARCVPDEIVTTDDFNATVAEISDDPMYTSADYADSTVGPDVVGFTAGYPAPPSVDETVSATARIRFKAINDFASLQSIKILDGAAVVETLTSFSLELGDVFTISSGYPRLAAGQEAMLIADFDLSAVVDLEDLRMEVEFFIEAECRCYALDYVYRVSPGA